MATTGGPSPRDVLPADRRPANVRLEQFIPFAELMPAVDLLVTNGGYGGVQTALVHGVPLVAAGMSDDKVEVNARVAWAGAGVALRANRPSSRRIGAAVRKVLADSSYRDRARHLRDQYARYPGAARAAAVILEAAAARPVPVASIGPGRPHP